jgi:NIMA (never in mitosis gene a)-related kinase 1/4/5
VAWQLCLALLHIHSHDIIHRDIKPLNVLVTKDRNFKLGDLSESIIVTKERYLKSKTVGTPLYLSPEIIKKQQYDHRTDIFSLGVVMYHMAALEVPYNDKSLEGLMNKILYKQPLPFQVAYSDVLK